MSSTCDCSKGCDTTSWRPRPVTWLQNFNPLQSACRFNLIHFIIFSDIYDHWDTKRNIEEWPKFTINSIPFWSWTSGLRYVFANFRVRSCLRVELQYSHLITRRCREHNVYAELMPCTTKIQDINFKPKGLHYICLMYQLDWTYFPSGIILSGSPYSVYDNVSPHVDLAVFDLGVPILGICYGLQV